MFISNVFSKCKYLLGVHVTHSVLLRFRYNPFQVFHIISWARRVCVVLRCYAFVHDACFVPQAACRTKRMYSTCLLELAVVVRVRAEIPGLHFVLAQKDALNVFYLWSVQQVCRSVGQQTIVTRDNPPQSRNARYDNILLPPFSSPTHTVFVCYELFCACQENLNLYGSLGTFLPLLAVGLFFLARILPNVFVCPAASLSAVPSKLGKGSWLG